MASRLVALTYQLEASDAARAVRAPTLILHRRGDRAMRFEAGRALASLIPSAELVVLDGNIHLPWLGDARSVTAPILRFLAGQSPAAETARAPTEGTPHAPEPPELVRRGDVWQIRFAGPTVHVKHSKGLADIAQLVSRRGQELDATALAYADAPEGAPAEAPDPVLDGRALASYRRRLRDLEASLAEADARPDLGARGRLVAQRDALLDELGRATRLGGASRRLHDPRERARKAGSARIRDSLATLRGVHPALAEHLDAAIVTGSKCSYAPRRA